VEGLVAQDASIIPLASDVLFVSPTGSERKGIDEVAPFLEAQEFNEIRVHQTLIDGEYGCELTDYYWTEGETVPVALCLRVVDGEITEIRPYFDTALLDGN
jgi:limonene-1,2-epoxide hydrolase